MSNDSKEIEDKVEFAVESCQKFGASVLTVSDGHVLLFTRERLKQILEAHPDKPQVVIHVKTRTFGD